MISRFRLATAFVVVILLSLGQATPARAGLLVTVQEDAGTIFTLYTSAAAPTADPSGAGSKTTANYKATLVSGEAFENGLTFSELLSATVSITKTTASTGHTLHIVVLGTGYMNPITPPDVNVSSHIGGTTPVSKGVGNTLKFHSFVNALDIGAQTPTIPGAGSFDNTRLATLKVLGAPFSLKETIDIVLNAKGDTLNYSSSTVLTQIRPVPEPASMALVLSGLPMLAFAGWKRRRQR